MRKNYLFTQKQYDESSLKDLLKCKCLHCHIEFNISKKRIYDAEHFRNNGVQFCSNKCNNDFRKLEKLVICKQCNTSFYKKNAQIKKHPNHFCSRSCSATYNNLHKKSGIRRSKLEIYLEETLPVIFPNLNIEFNSKTAINSELDIYIPNLQLAFELNGIYHYEPIHGKDKLTKIQHNDQNKFQLCQQYSISLCIIDTTSQKKFTKKSSQKFLDIIVDIIKQKLS